MFIHVDRPTLSKVIVTCADRGLILSTEGFNSSSPRADSRVAKEFKKSYVRISNETTALLTKHGINSRNQREAAQALFVLLKDLLRSNGNIDTKVTESLNAFRKCGGVGLDKALDVANEAWSTVSRKRSARSS